MRANEVAALEKRLEAFLNELTEPMGRRDRRQWAGAYVRGLLLDGERKSVEPMARRLGKSDQALQQFLNQSPWSAEALLERLAKCGARQPANFWILDETSFPKAGKHSVGVTRQYCGALGKIANCQVAVSLHRAESGAQASQPISWRLYLPKEWVQDAERRQHAGIPAEVLYQSKNELALSLLDQALSWELKPGVILADEAYGGSFEWRAALRERGLFYAVRVPWTTTGWTQAPEFFLPAPPKRGRQAKRLRTNAPIPKNLREIAREMPESAWSEVTWREGSKGPQRSRFAQLPLWAANGWRQGPQPERVKEVALIEWPVDEEEPTRYWLSLLPESLPLNELVAAARARWRIEQDYRELKEELGLDHFEGRGWVGWHHHVAMVTVAFAFLRQEQRKKRRSGAGKKPARTPKPAARAKAPPGRSHSSRRPLSLVPHPLQTA
jgi:SRSO17 transposase